MDRERRRDSQTAVKIEAVGEGGHGAAHAPNKT